MLRHEHCHRFQVKQRTPVLMYGLEQRVMHLINHTQSMRRIVGSGVQLITGNVPDSWAAIELERLQEDHSSIAGPKAQSDNNADSHRRNIP